MDPIAQANSAAQLVVERGTLGAVLLGASLLVAGLCVAVTVLWRAREASEKRREEVQQRHAEWAIDLVRQQAEREAKLTEALQQHAGATSTVRDLLVRLLAERP